MVEGCFNKHGRCACPDVYREERDRLKEERDEWHERAGHMAEDVENAEAEIARLKDENTWLHKQIALLEDVLSYFRAENERLRKEIDDE